MKHAQVKPHPHALIPAALLAATLTFAPPLYAQTAEVVIRVPGTGDAGANLTLSETTDNIAGSLLAYVDRIDGITRDYRSCLETAARLKGADTATERRACAVALQGDKIDMLKDLQDTMADTGRQFYALAEKVDQMVDDTRRDLEAARDRISEIDAELALLRNASQGFFETLAPDTLTRQQKRTMREILRQAELARIQKRRAQKAMEAALRRQQWLADGQVRIIAWADTVTETGLDLAIPILVAEESIEDIKRAAEWDRLVSGASGVPATLNRLLGVFSDVQQFDQETTTVMSDLGEDGDTPVAELPGPGTDDAALYDRLAKLFQNPGEASQ